MNIIIGLVILALVFLLSFAERKNTLNFLKVAKRNFSFKYLAVSFGFFVALMVLTALVLFIFSNNVNKINSLTMAPIVNYLGELILLSVIISSSFIVPDIQKDYEKRTKHWRKFFISWFEIFILILATSFGIALLAVNLLGYWYYKRMSKREDQALEKIGLIMSGVWVFLYILITIVVITVWVF